MHAEVEKEEAAAVSLLLDISVEAGYFINDTMFTAVSGNKGALWPRVLLQRPLCPASSPACCIW